MKNTRRCELKKEKFFIISRVVLERGKVLFLKVLHFILFMYLFTLSACGYTIEEKIEINEYEKKAKKNAATYGK